MAYLLYAILALGSGAVISFLGLGIVLAYRGSGVINFAQGAIAAYVAYVFYGLRTSGQYMLPVPGLPPFIQIGPADGLPIIPSVALALITALLLGLVLQLIVLKPLSNAPTLAKVVATIGVMILLESLSAYRFGTATVTVPNVLPDFDILTLASGHVPVDRPILMGLAIIAMASLAFLYRYTRFGIATRAAAENEKGAVLLGYSPGFQAGLNWILASLLAGVGGILVSPLTGLTPDGFTLLIIPALAAALVGRFTSFGITCAAATLIAVAQAELTALPGSVSWFPSIGISDAVPFVVIIIVMMVMGRSLPTRGMTLEGNLPRVPEARIRSPWALVALFGCLALIFTVNADYRLALINTIIGAILCLSMVTITGFLGQISLFPLAVAGLAAYTLAALYRHSSLPFPLAPLGAVLLATVLGLLAGLPALRVRGVNLAVVTLAAGWAIEQVYFNNPNYTGGFYGATIPTLSIWGLKIPLNSGTTIAQPSFAIFSLIVLILVALLVLNIRRGGIGRRMLAVRTNERAAAAAGVSVAGTKLIAFGVSSSIAAIGGCLMAYQQSVLTPSEFDALISVTFLATAYLGGITTVSGAIVGGLVASGGLAFTLSQNLIYSHASNGLEISDLISGIGLILTAILNPQGIAGGMAMFKNQMIRKFVSSSRRSGAAAAALRPRAEEGAETEVSSQPTALDARGTT